MAISPFLTSGQCRAARAFLNWSIDRLSDRSQVRVSTISLFERDVKDPPIQQMQALKAAFEAEGVVFDCGRVQCVCPPRPVAEKV